MTFVREYGLVPNRGDSERFVKLVKWDQRWTPVPGTDQEELHLVPTVWEWGMLDVSNPRAHDYSGPVFKPVPVAITELLVGLPIHSTWPREASTEPEALRKARIRALRRACHIDEVVGAVEPAWVKSPGTPMMDNPVWDEKALAAA